MPAQRQLGARLGFTRAWLPLTRAPGPHPCCWVSTQVPSGLPHPSLASRAPKFRPRRENSLGVPAGGGAGRILTLLLPHPPCPRRDSCPGSHRPFLFLCKQVRALAAESGLGFFPSPSGRCHRPLFSPSVSESLIASGSLKPSLTTDVVLDRQCSCLSPHPGHYHLGQGSKCPQPLPGCPAPSPSHHPGDRSSDFCHRTLALPVSELHKHGVLQGAIFSVRLWSTIFLRLVHLVTSVNDSLCPLVTAEQHRSVEFPGLPSLPFMDTWLVPSLGPCKTLPRTFRATSVGGACVALLDGKCWA